MLDLNKTYSVEEIRQLRFGDLYKLQQSFEKVVAGLLTKEEVDTLTELNELEQAPYYYAINKFHFIPGMEQEDIDRQEKIENIQIEGNKVREKIKKEVPRNVLETLKNILISRQIVR